MTQGSDDYSLFKGLVFWGSEHLPKDLVISPGEIRQWAIDQELIWDDEAQFVASERIKELKNHFTAENARGKVLQYNKANNSYGGEVGSETTYLHLKADR